MIHAINKAASKGIPAYECSTYANQDGQKIIVIWFGDKHSICFNASTEETIFFKWKSENGKIVKERQTAEEWLE